jgi:hypothetical protein
MQGMVSQNKQFFAKYKGRSDSAASYTSAARRGK